MKEEKGILALFIGKTASLQSVSPRIFQSQRHRLGKFFVVYDKLFIYLVYLANSVFGFGELFYLLLTLHYHLHQLHELEIVVS